jgi:hypothetical protein
MEDNILNNDDKSVANYIMGLRVFIIMSVT